MYNLTFFCDIIVPILIDTIWSYFPKMLLKSLYVDLDSGCSHNWVQSSSTDRALSRYYRHNCKSLLCLWHLDEILRGIDIPDREHLKITIAWIFNEISNEILLFVFSAWIKHLNWVIKCKEEYWTKGNENERNSLWNLSEMTELWSYWFVCKVSDIQSESWPGVRHIKSEINKNAAAIQHSFHTYQYIATISPARSERLIRSYHLDFPIWLSPSHKPVPLESRTAYQLVFL